jgi:hypothetical protein
MFDRVRRYVSPFHSQARRWFGLGASSLDILVETGAEATLSTAGVLTVTRATHGDSFYYSTPERADREEIAAWVTEFNRRAGENRGPGWPT